MSGTAAHKTQKLSGTALKLSGTAQKLSGALEKLSGAVKNCRTQTQKLSGSSKAGSFHYTQIRSCRKAAGNCSKAVGSSRKAVGSCREVPPELSATSKNKSCWKLLESCRELLQSCWSCCELLELLHFRQKSRCYYELSFKKLSGCSAGHGSLAIALRCDPALR